MTTVSRGAHPGRLQATSATEIAVSFGRLKRSRVHCATRSTAWRRSGPFLTEANMASAYQKRHCMRKCADGAPRPLPPRRRHGMAGDAFALADDAQLLVQEARSEEHTSELQSRPHLVCRLLLEKKIQIESYMRTGEKEIRSHSRIM